MTREEAIEFGNIWLEVNEDCKDSNTYAFFQMAIKALEKEPTTKKDLAVDCIDRQAAITFACKNTKEILKDTMPLEVKLSDDYLYENVAKIMRNPKVLLSVTPQEPRWIPVTEELPKKDGLYLVSVKNDHLRRYSKTCWYSNKNWFARQDVVAWMPLLQPYKAESEDAE